MDNAETMNACPASVSHFRDDARPLNSEKHLAAEEPTGSESNRGTLLYTFSGPRRPEDGFDVFCKELGYECKCLDTEISSDHNLLDTDVWTTLMKDLPMYDGHITMRHLHCGEE